MMIFTALALIGTIISMSAFFYNMGYNDADKDWTYTPEVRDEIDLGEKTYLVSSVMLDKDDLQNESVTIIAWEKK